MPSRRRGSRVAIATIVTVSMVSACSGDGDSDGAPVTRPSSTLIGGSSTDVPSSDPATTESAPGTDASTTVEPATTAATATTETPSPSTPDATAAPEDLVWPVPDWQTTTPAEAGLDPAALELMADRAERAESDCLVVTHDGSIVAEWYWNDTNQRSEREAFSVTKSITSTLVGIAIDQGALTLDQKASDFITEWVGTPSEDITVRNLVSNDSGRYNTFQSDYVLMPQAENQTAYGISLEQEHEIGEEWVYNNAAIQTLEAVLEGATGMHVGDFAAEYLFGPLGMNTTIIEDKAGNTLMYMGAQASCRDLARFGLLFLRGGNWDGRQIVSRAWVDEATSPSTELNTAYGFLWWLSPDGPGDGPIPRSAPDDMFGAHGLFDQLVSVLPSEKVVVTRMGEPEGPDGTTFGHNDIADGILEATTG